MIGRLPTAVRGAAAGAVASGAMGLVLLGARRAGIVSEAAPEEITDAALDAVSIDASETAENAASTIAHLAYGATSGALYGLLRPHLPLGPVVGGLAFAGALMAASYEGWVPAAGAAPPLHAQTPGGRWTLVAGHTVYGLVLGRLASGPTTDSRHKP